MRLRITHKLTEKRWGLCRPTPGHRPPGVVTNCCVSDGAGTVPCLTFRLIFIFFVEVWPARESFGMARGPRFKALGADSGPRGGVLRGFGTPTNNKKYICVLVPKGRLRSAQKPMGFHRISAMAPDCPSGAAGVGFHRGASVSHPTHCEVFSQLALGGSKPWLYFGR